MSANLEKRKEKIAYQIEDEAIDRSKLVGINNVQLNQNAVLQNPGPLLGFASISGVNKDIKIHEEQQIPREEERVDHLVDSPLRVVDKDVAQQLCCQRSGNSTDSISSFSAFASGNRMDTPTFHVNEAVNKDMQVVGRLWGDEEEDFDNVNQDLITTSEEVNIASKYLADNPKQDNPDFTEVISKSKKKKLNKKQLEIKNNEGYRTRSKGGNSDLFQC